MSQQVADCAAASNIPSGIDSMEQCEVPQQAINGSYTDVNDASNAVSDNGKIPVEISPPNTNHRPDIDELSRKKARVSYASLFKNNRMASEEYKLEFVETGADKLEFGIDDIDSIEATYGICLLGYVISGKPPTAALFDLVRRWGPDVKFQTHESGWIIFTFPNVETKNRILGGGSHMVFGYHLFLKEMQKCFRFREEDMNSVPCWVQIHGLPPDCWNVNILSKLASRIGTPIHMDMLTYQRKRVKYARVLIEIEAPKPKTVDMVIGLPIGDVSITFKYEQDIKFCSHCRKVGHIIDTCVHYNRQGTNNMNGDASRDSKATKRMRSRSLAVKQRQSRGRSTARNPSRAGPSRAYTDDFPQNHSKSIDHSNVPPVVPIETTDITPITDDATGSNQRGTMDNGKKPATGENIVENQVPIVPVGDDFKTVTNKKENKKNKKKQNTAAQQKGNIKDLKEFFKDMEPSSTCDTEYVDMNSSNASARYFGNNDKGRHPSSASGYQ